MPKSVVIKSYSISPSDTLLNRSNKISKGKGNDKPSKVGNTPSKEDNTTSTGGGRENAPLKGENTTSKIGTTKKTDNVSSKPAAVQSDNRNPRVDSILCAQLLKPKPSTAPKRLPKLAVIQPTNRLKRPIQPKVSKLPLVTTVPRLIPVTDQKIVKLFQNVKLPLTNIKIPTSQLSALNDTSKATLSNGSTVPVVVKPHNSRLVYVRSKDGKKILIGK